MASNQLHNVVPIYAMPAFDNLEFVYASSKRRRCPGWVRVGLRLFFGGLTFFIAVAFPFLGSLAPLIGGMAAVPLTFVLECQFLPSHDTSKFMIGLILWLAISCITSYQIYAMPAFDNLEFVYASSKRRRCPGGFGWVYGFSSRADVVHRGGVSFLGKPGAFDRGMAAVPLTFVYPCFMWISIRKPRPNSGMWCLNMGLGCSGVLLSILLIVCCMELS
ncbi:Lysine histidine transporter-like 8, putative isoform 2 [Hibiscus syriacus]|uniref:Lysine histidine transporter-like 8, putative isoform 2 n=1 Tax=Hibiscus syriacus TaxID=106335 RepID=A0A6A3CC42_HIBSY|nr:Lysine histidine transporter-like 8, putative isoform 2 [Hibiscus syriacus]